MLRLVSACLCLAAVAHAQGPVRLEYHDEVPAAGCPTEAELREIISARVGFDPFAEDAPTLVRITVRARSAREVELLVELVGPDTPPSERSFVGPRSRCQGLAENVSLVVALAVEPISEPEAVSEAAPPQDPPALVPVPNEVPTPTAVDPASSTAPPPRGEHLSIQIGATFDARFLRTPLPTLGASVSAALRGTYFSVAVLGSMALSPVELESASAARVSSSVYTGGARGCGHYDVGVLCLGAAMGAYQTQARNVAMPSTQTSFYAEISLASGVEWLGLPWLGLQALAELAVPLVRLDIAMGGLLLYAAPPVSLGLSLSLLTRVG